MAAWDRIRDTPFEVLLPWRVRGRELTKREAGARNGLWVAAVYGTLACILPLFFMRSLWFFGAFGFFSLGVALLNLGICWRRGLALHCAKCNHQVPPFGKIPDRCQECGADWTSREGTVAGRRIRTPWMIWVGAACLALFVVITFSGIFIPPLHWRYAPVRLLSGSLSNPSRHFYGSEWDQLMARNLSAEDQAIIMDALLIRLEQSEHAFGPEFAWLEQAVMAPGTPQEFVDRYCQQALSIQLVLPEQASAGKEFPVHAVVRQRSWITLKRVTNAWITAINIGEKPVNVEWEQTRGISVYREEMADPLEPRAEHTMAWKAIAPTQPQRTVVRMEVTIVSGKFPSTSLAQIQPDGTLAIDPSADYVKTVIIEQPIEIVR